MARRKQENILEILFQITTVLPWWVGTIAAVIAYFVLHQYALSEVQTNVAPGQIGQMMVDQAIKTLSIYGQYIVPTVLFAGSIVSIWRNKHGNDNKSSSDINRASYAITRGADQNNYSNFKTPFNRENIADQAFPRSETNTPINRWLPYALNAAEEWSSGQPNRGQTLAVNSGDVRISLTVGA